MRGRKAAETQIPLKRGEKSVRRKDRGAGRADIHFVVFAGERIRACDTMQYNIMRPKRTKVWIAKSKIFLCA